jgi:SAM-dependent methyltransferase
VTTLERAAELLQSLCADVDQTRWTGVQGEFEAFEASRSFDTVIATYVLEHVPDPDALLARIHGWLAPGGKAVIVVPNALSLHRRLARTMGLVDDPARLGDADLRVGHLHAFTAGRIEASIERAGFRVVDRAGLLAKSLPSALLTACSERQLRGLFDLGLDLPMEFAAILYYLVAPNE